MDAERNEVELAERIVRWLSGYAMRHAGEIARELPLAIPGAAPFLASPDARVRAERSLEARRSYSRRYAREHAEELKEYGARYRAANRERRAEAQRVRTAVSRLVAAGDREGAVRLLDEALADGRISRRTRDSQLGRIGRP